MIVLCERGIEGRERERGTSGVASTGNSNSPALSNPDSFLSLEKVMTTTTTTTTRRLESLLGVPSPDRARRAAQTSLTLSVSSSPSSSSPTPLAPSQQLGQLLSSLLETELINQDRLSKEVEESREKKDELLIKTRQQTKTIHSNLKKLKRDNLELQKGAQQIKNSLTRDLDQEDDEEEGQDEDTLREKLIKLSSKRKQLQSAKQWFGIIVQAEQIGLAFHSFHNRKK